ncbi:MAG: lipopolysaccharide biosynthesis protein [Acidobacteriota bacterium]|nr:lipopolysaccharide biosynthesis protein [Acidobacteriota bacterium]
MLGHRTLTPEDFVAIVKRRGWMLIVPTVVMMLLAFAITFVVPPKFISQTLVLVEEPKVPDDYVKPVVDQDLSGRLASMQEQILSRSRLQPIIERFNLYGNKGMGMDERLDRVRKDIDIKIIHSDISRAGGLPGFFISFTSSDPHIAQQVCGEITSLFVSENLEAREQTAEGTTDFLKSQLEDAKRNLDEQDAKLASFQMANAGRLPGEEATNLNMLSSLNTQMDAATQALGRLEQDKTYMEAMLAQQLRDLPPADTAVSAKQTPQAQQAQLDSLLAQEADLTSRYTPDYPDVVEVRRKISELRRQMAAAPAPAAPSTVTRVNRAEPPNVQQLRAQLRAQDQAIAAKRAEQQSLAQRISEYQSRIHSSPEVQEQFKNITRDYQTAQQFYDDLLKKMNQSKMATDLERRQQGEQFRVMDEPNLPDSPSFPKKGIFLAGGFAFGFMVGLVWLGLTEYRDTAMRSERDVWAFTKLPTLGVISLLDGSETADAAEFQSRPGAQAAAGKPLMNVGG